MQKEELKEILHGLTPHKKPTLDENTFLKILADKKIPVNAFLVNGIRLHGVIKAFDSLCILLDGSENNGQQQLVYKHAISTVSPQQDQAKIIQRSW